MVKKSTKENSKLTKKFSKSIPIVRVKNLTKIIKSLIKKGGSPNIHDAKACIRQIDKYLPGEKIGKESTYAIIIRLCDKNKEQKCVPSNYNNIIAKYTEENKESVMHEKKIQEEVYRLSTNEEDEELTDMDRFKERLERLEFELTEPTEGSWRTITAKIIGTLSDCKKGHVIFMSFINGDTLFDIILDQKNKKNIWNKDGVLENKLDYDTLVKRLVKAYKVINKLHKFNIFHGDTHTRNIMYDNTNEKMIIIDFGQSNYLIEGPNSGQGVGYAERQKMTDFYNLHESIKQDFRSVGFTKPQQNSILIDVFKQIDFLKREGIESGGDQHYRYKEREPVTIQEPSEEERKWWQQQQQEELKHLELVHKILEEERKQKQEKNKKRKKKVRTVTESKLAAPFVPTSRASKNRGLGLGNQTKPSHHMNPQQGQEPLYDTEPTGKRPPLRSLAKGKKWRGASKTKKVRKHKGIVQTGGNKGRLRKGYRYSGKKLKSGKSEIVKCKSKKC